MNPSTLTHSIARTSLQSAAAPAAGNASRLSCRSFRYRIQRIPQLPQVTGLADPGQKPSRHACRLTITPPTQPTLQPRTPHRPFSTTPPLLKKGAKAARDSEKQSQSAQGKDSPAAAAAEDPSDFSALEADIAAATERLKDDLSKLRAGGRFNPETLESLRVQPDKAAGAAKAKVKLSDLAQVVPKGRTIQVLVGERDHVKPVSSAIQSSNLSLTPQPDPTGSNPLLLVVNVPPPTSESRKAAVAEAVKAGERAGGAVKDARARQQKKLRGMQLSKAVRPDELKKAGAAMEKVVEKGGAEVKRVVEAARKVLESG